MKFLKWAIAILGSYQGNDQETYINFAGKGGNTYYVIIMMNAIYYYTYAIDVNFNDAIILYYYYDKWYAR